MYRQIDPRSHRFGSTLSAVLLIAGFLANVPLVIPVVGLALGVSGLTGTRWSILGWPWPAVSGMLRIGPPTELESEVPARFAQLLAAVVLGLASVPFLMGWAIVGWAIAGALAALQLWLAATGFCIGCRLYFLRWYAPKLFNRIFAPSVVEPVDGSTRSA